MVGRREFLIGAGCMAIVPLPAIGATEVAALILNYSNSARRSAGLAALAPAPALARAADQHARAMARAGRLSHTVGGTTPVTRARGAGYRYSTLAENIGYRSTGRLDADGMARYFVTGWLESPAHRRNLLSRKVREAGIGVASDGNRLFAVQMLAARRG